MANIITEDNIEQAAIKLLVEQNGYSFIDCMTKESETLPDNTGRADKIQVVLPGVLFESLCRLNPEIPADTVRNEAEKLCFTPADADPMQANYDDYKIIREGIPVEYEKNGRKTNNTLKLMDFNNPEANSFIVASQMWIRGEIRWRRPDLIIFVNGLPLVFIELKNSNINVKNAYDKNLQDYRRDIPYLFNFNQICVLSNAIETRLGSFSAGYELFFEWLKVAGEEERPDRNLIRASGASLEYFIRGLCKKETLLDYIENFILYDRRMYKIIAKSHQYFGVNNAYKSFLTRDSHPGKLGVFWHTQGSGKSYSMRMLAGKIRRKCSGNFTFLIVTDRDELDEQIYKNFERTEFISKEEKVRPSNSSKLREELKTNKTVLFTLIQKFVYDKGKQYPVLSDRSDIIVMVDEAHRTQYKDLADNMRRGLPNAQFIAFTGTPLLGSKRLTNQWFGDYVSEYTFADSILDNATVPLFYVKHVSGIVMSNKYLDSDFTDILDHDNLTDAERERLTNIYAKNEEIFKRDDWLEDNARNIVQHFPRRGFLGKGMVISVDKFTAVRMYDKVQRLWKEEIQSLNLQIMKSESEEERLELKKVRDYMNGVEMAVVVSEEADEEKKFEAQGLSIKKHRERMNHVDENGIDIEDDFKNPHHPLQLVFVCSMWLTGFDAPSVSTLYIDKPMKGHTLMQAIARANRVFPGKTCGIIVDHLDLFKYLKNALAEYADGDDGEMPIKDLDKLVGQLNEAVEKGCSFCLEHGVDLNLAVKHGEYTLDDSELFSGFADKIVSSDEVRNEFRVYANTVSDLYEALKPEILNMQFDPTYKKAIIYLEGVIEGKIRPEKLEAARKKIDQLLDQSVAVVKDKDTFALSARSKELDLSKLDFEAIRAQFKQIKYKNLEIADLREHIEKKLAQMLKKNVTRSSFAERFQNIIDEYNAGGSLNDEFYDKLLKFMEDMKKEEERHVREDLSEEELEIFDLLRKDKLTKDEEKRVKLAAHALYKRLTEKQTELFIVDWYKDAQPRGKVLHEIKDVLNENLPDSYDKEIFNAKTDALFEHMVDQAMTGNWSWARA